MAARLDVRKTYKLYIGGTFPRSESGRSYEVFAAPARAGATPRFLANAAQGSRKDARDAVVAARAAQPGWAGATAYNRGQVLYRVAEVMEGRRAQFAEEVRVGEGISPIRADSLVSQAIDRWVWYAGWTDKIAQVAGNPNPVAGPFFNLSVPEPCGVVAILAPQESSLLGLVSVIAPAIATGNTAVVVSSKDRPLPAVTLSECLATSDVPGGVVNIITGERDPLAAVMAKHDDIACHWYFGSREGSASVERESAGNLKATWVNNGLARDWFSPQQGQGREFLFHAVRIKTIWTPFGV